MSDINIGGVRHGGARLHRHHTTTNHPPKRRKVYRWAHDAPPRTAAFDQACGMEDPLRAIRNFALTLDRVAQTLDDDNAAAIVQELGLAIQSRVDELDEIHGYFCRLHHPGGTTTTEARA